MIWRLIVDIYEEGTTAYPVVTHIFNGRTQQEAEGYYEAHLRADAFLRGCAVGGHYEHAFSCYAVKRWEKAPLGG